MATIEVPIVLNARTASWLTAKMIEWGYLDANFFLEDAGSETKRKFADAVVRAIPRLILEAERKDNAAKLRRARGERQESGS
jgi:hypothetical protein